MPSIGTPKGLSDLLSGPFQHCPGDMHVPGPHTGRSPGLPAHDRVDHDVRDPEDQENGRSGVTSVMKLGGLVLAAGLLLLGAVAGFPAARIVPAAVGVLGAQPVLADPDVSRVQVDVLPVQPERLPLAERQSGRSRWSRADPASNDRSFPS